MKAIDESRLYKEDELTNGIQTVVDFGQEFKKEYKDYQKTLLYSQLF